MRPRTLSEPIGLRLGTQQRALLEAEAKRLCIPLQELIRQRLDVTAAVQGPLETLRDEIVYALGKADRSPGPGRPSVGSGLVTDALLIEVCLALRQILSPGQLHEVRRSIVRLGLEPWTGPEQAY